jgi:hypothetical protein
VMPREKPSQKMAEWDNCPGCGRGKLSTRPVCGVCERAARRILEQIGIRKRKQSLARRLGLRRGKGKK